MPISTIPRVGAKLPAEVETGSLVIAQFEEEPRKMGLAFVAAADDRPARRIICLTPADMRLRIRPEGEATFIDLGRNYAIEFDAAELDCLAPSWGWQNDVPGGALIGPDGALAVVLPDAQGEPRYYHLDSGMVDFARPAAANAIILKWSISVGHGTDKRTIAVVDVRPQQG